MVRQLRPKHPPPSLGWSCRSRPPQGDFATSRGLSPRCSRRPFPPARYTSTSPCAPQRPARNTAHPRRVCSHPLVIVNRVPEDLGPITKLAPVLTAETDPDTLIVVVDDDRHYAPDLIEALLSAHRDRPDAALGSGGWTAGTAPWNFMSAVKSFDPQVRKRGIVPVDWLEGVSGMLLRRDFFEDEAALLRHASEAPQPHAWYMDDVVVSSYLARRGVPRLLIRRRSPHSVGDRAVESIMGMSNDKAFFARMLVPLVRHYARRGLWGAAHVGIPLRTAGFWISLALVAITAAALVAAAFLGKTLSGCRTGRGRTIRRAPPYPLGLGDRTPGASSGIALPAGLPCDPSQGWGGTRRTIDTSQLYSRGGAAFPTGMAAFAPPSLRAGDPAFRAGRLNA